MLKTFVWLHRWLGIVLCLLFAVWFASGAVLLFVPFPSLDGGEARARADPVALNQVKVRPQVALAGVRGGTAIRLVGRLGTPVYVIGTAVGDQAVSAETGAAVAELTPGQAGTIASRFGSAPVSRVTGPIRYDQWIVHQAFDHVRPLYRVSLADRYATQLYVSAQTGEVVQKTRGYERAWNWLGAVVHWLYFTPLRRFFSAWDQTVWWVSLVGLAMTAVGIGLGVYRTAKKMGSKRPAVSPFKGWLKWHHILGLSGGVVVLTWIFSGWLSMDHGRLFSRATTSEHRLAAYEGTPLAHALRQIDLDRLQRLGYATSVRFGVVGGELVVAGIGPSSSSVLVGGDAPLSRTSAVLVTKALQAAYTDSHVSPPEALGPDDFYAKAEGAPAGTESYRLTGAYKARVFVNPATGDIVAVVNRSRAAYDWVYYALHSFNFPGLLALPVLRALIVLPLLALGFALCITSIVVGIRRLRIVAAA